MKKTNKLLLSIGALGAIATPVVAVISCGHQGINKNSASKDATEAELRHIETPEESLFWSSWLTGAGTTLIKAKGFSEYASIPAGYQIPSTVQVIDGAFEGITLPKDFFIPSHVTVIKSNSFAHAKLAQGFTIPSTVTLIEKDAFYDATLPSGLSIPSTTQVDNGAFNQAAIPTGAMWLDQDGDIQNSSYNVQGNWRIASNTEVVEIRTNNLAKAQAIIDSFDETKITGYDKSQLVINQMVTSEDDRVRLRIDGTYDSRMEVTASAQVGDQTATKHFTIEGFKTRAMQLAEDLAVGKARLDAITEADFTGINKDWYATVYQHPVLSHSNSNVFIENIATKNNELIITIATNVNGATSSRILTISGFAPLPDVFWKPWISDNGRTLRKPQGFTGDIPAGEIIPSTVTIISPQAFMGMALPEGFTLPTSIKKIGASAFAGATLPASFELPEGLLIIDSNAFTQATFNSFVQIPSTVETMGEAPFSSATFNKGVGLQVGISEIGGFYGYDMFYHATIKEKLVIPSTLKSILNDAFFDSHIFDGFIYPDLTYHGNVAFSKGFWTAPNGVTHTVPQPGDVYSSTQP